MRGRKREPGAVRDGRTPATELARVEAVPTEVSDNLRGPAEKPEWVASSPNLSRRWDELVGNGAAYKPQDVPLLFDWVFQTELAIQLSQQLTAEDGTIRTMVDEWRGENLVQVENPLLRQYNKAVEMSLKLAEHFGGTPMARARLGLTQAVTANIGEDIRRKVLQAMRERSLMEGRDVQD